LIETNIFKTQQSNQSQQQLKKKPTKFQQKKINDKHHTIQLNIDKMHFNMCNTSSIEKYNQIKNEKLIKNRLKMKIRKQAIRLPFDKFSNLRNTEKFTFTIFVFNKI
jgi:hypothetical protein